MRAFIMIAVLMVGCESKQFTNPFGKDLNPNSNIKHFSKSLVHMNNSLVYGIRPVDGMIVMLWQEVIDKMNDSTTLETLLDTTLGKERFLFCQNLIYEDEGLVVMMILFETEHKTGHRSDLYYLHGFYQYGNPDRDIVISYDKYKTGLRLLNYHFFGPRGYHHVLTLEHNIVKLHSQFEKKTYTLESQTVLYNYMLQDSWFTSKNPVSRGLNAHPISMCLKVNGGKYAWIVKDQGANPNYKFKIFAHSKHRFMVDALYLRRKKILDKLANYYRGKDVIWQNSTSKENPQFFPQYSRVIMLRKGYICSMYSFLVVSGYRRTLDFFRYTHAKYHTADRITKMLAFSSYGLVTNVVVDTSDGVFYKTYDMKQKEESNIYECIGLNFGKNSIDKDTPVMDKLNITQKVVWADFNSFTDLLKIFTKDYVYQIKDATNGSFTLTRNDRQGKSKVTVTDSFLTTSQDYDESDNIPWQVRVKRTITPTKDGKSFNYCPEEGKCTKYGRHNELDFLLYFPEELLTPENDAKRRYLGKYVFYGIKDCTLFVVGNPSAIEKLQTEKKGCGVTKKIKVFMNGKRFVILQDNHDQTMSVWQLDLRIALERVGEALLFNISDDKFPLVIRYPGYFSTVFVMRDTVGYLDEERAKGDRKSYCQMPYYGISLAEPTEKAHALRSSNLDIALGIYNRDDKEERCRGYKVLSYLYENDLIRIYVVKKGEEILMGANFDSRVGVEAGVVYKKWENNSIILNQESQGLADDILTFRRAGKTYFIHAGTKVSTSFNCSDLRFVAPYRGGLLRQLGDKKSNAHTYIEEGRSRNRPTSSYSSTDPPPLITFEELEYQKVAEATRGCPSLWNSPYFVALVVKLLLVDFILTLLLLLLVIFHRMYIVPARRRECIKRGITRMKRKRGMKDRIKHRLAKLAFMGEDSSEDDFVTAAGGKGMTTTNGDDFVTANAGRGATTTGAGGTTTGGNDFVTAAAGQAGATTTGGDDFVTANAGKGGATTTGGDDFVTANVGKGRTTTTGGNDFVTANVGKGRTTATGGDDFVTAAGGKGLTTTTGAGAGKGTTTGDGFVTAAAGKGRTTIKHA